MFHNIFGTLNGRLILTGSNRGQLLYGTTCNMVITNTLAKDQWSLDEILSMFPSFKHPLAGWDAIDICKTNYTDSSFQTFHETNVASGCRALVLGKSVDDYFHGSRSLDF